MTRDQTKDKYFEWLVELVQGNGYDREFSYRRLLAFLHDTPFRWTIPMDENRAANGVALRDRFGYSNGCEYEAEIYLDEPCSVLEMMVALAVHCEESIMDDPNIGDRTAQWFWNMVVNLGLGSMSDVSFDSHKAKTHIDRFLNRQYEPDGRGGLFRIRDCPYDLRAVEIWHQFCWYLDSII